MDELIFWLAFIGAWMLMLGLGGAVIRYYPYIKKRAAGVLYYSIRRMQKIFKEIVKQNNGNVNGRMIY